MFRRLLSYLFGSPSLEALELVEARQAYDLARDVYMGRADAGDDRGMGESWRPYHAAKCRLLAAEIAVRRSSPDPHNRPSSSLRSDPKGGRA